MFSTFKTAQCVPIVGLGVVGITRLLSMLCWNCNSRLHVQKIGNSIGLSKAAVAHSYRWYIREWYGFEWKDEIMCVLRADNLVSCAVIP